MKSTRQTYQTRHRLSVGIITKDRPKDIVACLDSIKKQSVFPNELIVVDSSTNNLTKDLIRVFKDNVKYPVMYIYEPQIGFPIARNRVLNRAKYRWLAFTDDDCVLDQNWVKEIKKMINKYPSLSAIAGESKPYFVHNIVSQAVNFNEQHWKKRVIRNQDILDLETLDNKNVVYNLSFLDSRNICYDKNRTSFFGASDDCDLGMQIQKSGGKAKFNPKMIVYHKDLIDLHSYTKRIFIRSKAHATYEHKWQVFRNQMGFESFKQTRFIKFFFNYIRDHNLNIFETFLLFFLLVYSSLLVKCIKFSIKFGFNHDK